MAEPRTLLCCATAKGLAVVRAVRALEPAVPAAVATFEERGVDHSHHADITGEAELAGWPVLPLETVRSADPAWLTEHGVGRIICVGWPYLIAEPVMEALGGNVLVLHDSLLPKLRGFAPVVTAMLRGDDAVGVTLLFAAAAVDAGPIVGQRRLPLAGTERVGEVIAALAPLYAELVTEFLGSGGGGPGTPQDEAAATYSIWRDDADYWIDWSASAVEIERAVRALGSPYAGARTALDGERVVVHAARVEPDLPFAIRQPGKVWRLTPGGAPVVVCGDGLLTLTEATVTGPDGERPLVPMKRLRVRFGGGNGAPGA